MQIFGPAQVHGAQGISGPHAQRAAQPQPTDNAAQTDKLEISQAAQFAAQLEEVPDVRQDRVAEIRAAIASGTYETEGRLSAALDNLLDEIA